MHETSSHESTRTTTRDRRDRLTALLEVSRLVAAALDLDALYRALHDQFQQVVDATGFTLALCHGEGREIELPLRVSRHRQEIPERLPWGNGLTEYVIRTGRPLLLADRAWERAAELGCEPRSFDRPRSWILAPIRLGDRVLGVLQAIHEERDFAFDETDLSLLAALASHVAVAIENARLFERVRLTEARYRTLFLDLPVGVLVLDESGRIRSMNPAAVRLLARPEGELQGRSLIELVHPVQRAQVDRMLADTRRGAAPPRREIRFVRPDGSERVTGFNLAPLEDEAGGTVLVVLRDMTHEHVVRQNLIQTEKMAAMGFLLSGIAHELNNPLAGIRASIQMVLEDVDAEDRELLEMALRETDRAAGIVQRVRDFGRRGGERRRVNVNDLVKEVVELRAYASRNQNIALGHHCEPDLPEVHADPDELLQALMNLVQNAEQALLAKPEGERRITLATRRRDDVVELAVIDTGPGIPPEIRERVFDPFFTTKAPGEGTGLGLTVVHAIAEGHGGRVGVEETPGGGATVLLTLPISAPAGPAEAAAPRGAPVSAGVRILMVEDEPTIRDVVRRWCDRQGLHLTVAGDGRRALELIRQTPFDIVMLDLRMPGMDGREFFRRLQEEHPDLAGRVVFVTGDAVTGETREFLERAGRPVLLKPFDLAMLAERLAEVAGR